MPSSELLLVFFLTTATFSYIPGPAMIYAAGQTLARGRWAGLMAALGIHAGGYFHVAATASGLSILFNLVPSLYFAVKLAGALYLVWLGVIMVRAKQQKHGADVASARTSGRKAFLQSVAVEMLNPKTAIFFVAFLPQFVDPSAAFPVWLQFAILGTLVNLIFSSADIVCVFLAAGLTRRLRASSTVQRLVQRAGGCLLIALGARIALQKS